MFTGIVQGLGEVCSVWRGGRECRFLFRPLFELSDIQDGESIAVNGACLSVEKHDASTFTVYASAETVQRTTLGALAAGMRVNLERALAFGERLGGHLVSGHVDCLGTVAKIASSGQSLCCRVKFPAQYAPEIIVKGSIALDGISLTVNSCGTDELEVNIIPDSRRRTNISTWRPGTKLNMETDLIGKYVVNFMRLSSGQTMVPARGSAPGGLSREFLASNGFL